MGNNSSHAMETPDDLNRRPDSLDWITIRTTLKRQFDHLKSGNEVRVPGLDAAQATADMNACLKTCLGEIEGLLKSYSSRAS